MVEEFNIDITNRPQMPALLLYQYIEFLKEPLRKHGVEIENPIPRPNSDGTHVF